MPEKHKATDRSHGGPGSSHEREDRPGHRTGDSGGRPNHPPQPGAPTNDRGSHVSGGGGERDKHHTHDPRTKS